LARVVGDETGDFGRRADFSPCSQGKTDFLMGLEGSRRSNGSSAVSAAREAAEFAEELQGKAEQRRNFSPARLRPEKPHRAR
jgi:hypothetical protein